MARAINHGRRSLTAKAVRDDKKLINMFHQYKPIIITLSIIALIIIATVQYVQSLINKPIDLSIQNNKSELLDSEPSDNIVIPKEFEFKGAKIALAWTDDNTGENLIIQSDKKIYYGFNHVEVYFSITNTNKQDQDMDVVVWVGDERIRVEEMERIDTEGNGYSALALSAAAALSAGTVRKDIKGFTCGYTAQDNIESGQTNYYKITIKYPPMSKGEFFIETFGRTAREKEIETEFPAGNSVSISFSAYGHLDPWYNSNWSYWKKITINSSKVATTTSNFPVLATSTDSDLRTITHGGHVGNDNGYDIVFADSDGETLLNFEREKYASTTGEIVYWIKTDVSSTTDKVIYMYYGNASASDLATTTGVWDDNYVMVQHLTETPAGTTYDSTKYDNDGTTSGMDSADQVAGQVDGSLDFDGSNDYVNCGSAKVGNATEGITIESWIYTGSNNFDGVVQDIFADNSGNPNGENGFYFAVDDRGGVLAVNGISLVVDTAVDLTRMEWVDNAIGAIGWYHVVGLYDPGLGEIKIYVNGDEKSTNVYASGTGNYIPDTDENLYIGATNIGGSNFDGIIDEARIANVARTAGWIKTEYNNQVSVGSFMSFGEEVCVPKPVERSGGENVKIRIKGGTRIKGGVRF